MKNSSTHIISRACTRYWISARILYSLFFTALRYYSPIKSIRVLRQINRRKRIVQGISGMPRMFANRGRIFYELNTPGWPSPAFTRFFSNEMQKGIRGTEETDNIQNAVISITNKCSLNCSHCFEWDRLDHKEHLSHHDLIKISNKLQKAGASIIQVGGGEPLERFADCCAIARESETSTDFWLLTSGYGLDRFKTELLKVSGYTGINISLDHWDSPSHNAFRGDVLSFRWVCEGAANTLKSGLVLSFSLCATKEFITADNLYKYLELVKELGGSFIQVLEPRSIGRWKDADVKLNEGQQQIISDFKQTVNNDKRYAAYPVVVYHGGFQRTHGCLGGGNRYLYIDSYGDIHACPFCQRPYGNLLKSELKDILPALKKAGCHLFKPYNDT